MTYREDHPLEWHAGLPDAASKDIRKSFETNIRSSPYENCKTGDQVEAGDRIDTGANVFFYVLKVERVRRENSGLDLIAHGHHSGNRQTMVLQPDHYYQLYGGV